MKRAFFNQWVLLIAILSHGAFAHMARVELGRPPDPELKPTTAPRLTSARSPVISTTVTNGQVSGFSVDTDDRMDVLSLYHCVYTASESFSERMNWVGAVGSCNEGSVSDDFHNDTLRRINYYRAMVGLDADITFDPTKNAACQKAAMMMSRNGVLSHSPPPSWSCWSLEGSNAAAHGNLSWSSGDDYTGPTAIDGMIYDAGGSNIPVGHRRWLLYPRARVMGNGGIPGDGSYGSSAAVWVVGDFGPAPPLPEWTAWPNPGFVPYTLVPGRWSLSMASADFNSANVTMTRDGQPIALTIVHPTPSSPETGYGDRTLVWEPDDMPITSLSTDAVFTVSVTGISGGAATSASYTVTAIHPGDIGQDLTPSGSFTPTATLSNRYSLPPVEGADAYRVRIRTLSDTSWAEGAEDSPTPVVIDGTSAEYDLITSSLSRSGSKSFHMAFPDFVNQWFEINRTILPSAGSELSFYYRRRFSHERCTLAAEVSPNGGLSWETVWSVPGICGSSCGSGDWDSDWIAATADLSPWEGETLSIRFSLTYDRNIYTGTSSSYGFFVDDIAVSDALELTGSSVTNIPAAEAGFLFQPDTAGAYLIDVGVEGACYSYGYSDDLIVTSVPAIFVTGVADSNGTRHIHFTTAGGTCSTYRVDRMAATDDNWQQETGATLHADALRFSVTPSEDGPIFYRIDADMP